jgi:adenylate cyclase
VGEGSVERRLAAILSADVVGYSAMMAADEESTVRALNRTRDEIARLVGTHRGRVVDFRGDDFLAEFPSALDAVRCGVAIQGSPERELPFRVGIHLGDVMVEGERIYGDGVNISARLESLAEPGGICISGPVHEQVRHKLELPFLDLGEQQVKNLPDPVRVWRVLLDGEAPQVPSRSLLRRRLLVVAAFVALAGLGGFVIWPMVPGLVLDAFALDQPLVNPPLPDRPSMVVLPFTNLSDDPQQEYFADGMTEDLTTDLSQVAGLFVISRNSAFTFKGKRLKVEQVGRELGVRYVLEGSVRRLGERIRVNAQLIDSTTGFHVWAERYDERFEDLFDVQSRISERILAAVDVSIAQAERDRVRRRPTDDLNAYEAWLSGVGHTIGGGREAYARARPFYERALELDPDFAEAHASLAQLLIGSRLFLYSTDDAYLDLGEEHAARAVAIAPNMAEGHGALAMVHYARGDGDAALRESAIAVELAPNDVTALAWRGIVLLDYGNPLEGLQAFSEAVRLSPTGLPSLWSGLAYAYMRAGRPDEAVDLWERARRADPNLILPRLGLISHYQPNGNQAESEALVREVLAINPDLTVAKLEEAFRFRTEGMAGELRAAGMP